MAKAATVSWFELTPSDQIEALEMASAQLKRPVHLLEKDIWLVWVLSVIYQSKFASLLTFKGGTSLSKAHKVIERFSEDVDLTYDIRALIPDLLQDGDPLPASASASKKMTDEVRRRLPIWIASEVVPLLKGALNSLNTQVTLEHSPQDRDKLTIRYPALRTGTGYASSTVLLEFGARATGEPHQLCPIDCDMTGVIGDIGFPTAQALVMSAERTFWEKATAAHVYCLQGRLRGDRYARHWYDLAALADSNYFTPAIHDKALANQVATHKSLFFAEKDVNGNKIDYKKAVNGQLHIIPQDASLLALQQDYEAMLSDGLLPPLAPSFEAITVQCRKIEMQANVPLDTD